MLVCGGASSLSRISACWWYSSSSAAVGEVLGVVGMVVVVVSSCINGCSGSGVGQ